MSRATGSGMWRIPVSQRQTVFFRTPKRVPSSSWVSPSRVRIVLNSAAVIAVDLPLVDNLDKPLFGLFSRFSHDIVGCLLRLGCCQYHQPGIVLEFGEPALDVGSTVIYRLIRDARHATKKSRAHLRYEFFLGVIRTTK